MSFRSWVQGKIENWEISEIFLFSFKSNQNLSVFRSVHKKTSKLSDVTSVFEKLDPSNEANY